MNNRSDMESLLRRFVEDKVSEDELELLQDYLKTKDGLKSLDRIMKEYDKVFDTSQLLRISQTENHADLRFPRSRFVLIAASFIGILLAATVYFYVDNKLGYNVYETKAGETIEIILPDMTQVTLNSKSTLVYSKDWDSHLSRRVNLQGEGYFKVTHDPDKPFIVTANKVDVKVLGTIFNVKAYGEDRWVETTLVEGKVMIENEGQPAKNVVLNPNQKARCNATDQTILVSEVDTQSVVSWTKGFLVFTDEPFREIKKGLERRYGVRITVQDEASLQCRFNAKIQHESLEEVLNLFSANGDMTYQLNRDSEVLIKGRLCVP